MIDPNIAATLATLLSISARDLVELAINHIKISKKNRIENLAVRYEGTRKVIAAGLHRQAILQYYPLPELREAGLSPYGLSANDLQITTAIVNNPDLLRLNIPLRANSENHTFSREIGPQSKLPKKMVAKIISDIEIRKLRVWNQPTYCVRSLSVEGDRISISFYSEDFFLYRYGLGALWDELVQAIIDCGYSVETLVNKKQELLRYRQSLMPTAESVAQYSERTCVSGIHGMVAMWRDEYQDYVFPVQRRSAALSEGQGLLTTIPQAFHQPMVDFEYELNLRKSFFREMFEEMFGGEEATEKVRRLKPDWYMKESEPLEWLDKHPDSFELILTGAGINLFSGNYEFSILCRIYDGEFWELFAHQLKANWETAKDISPLVSTLDNRLPRQILNDKSWTCSGLFSVMRGLSVLKANHESAVSLNGVEELVEE